MSEALNASPAARRGLAALLLLVLLEAALVICWSAGFVGTRFAIGHAPIFLVLLWRSLVSGLVLLPFALTIGPRITLKNALAHSGFAMLSMCGYLASFAIAISEGVPTGLVALIADMLPLAVALLSWPLLGQSLNARQWLGSGVALAGVLVASGASLRMGSQPLSSYALPVLGTISFALGILLQKRSRASLIPIHQSLCIQCLAAAAVFGLFAWREGQVLPVLDAGFGFGILWLVFIATFGAWSLYYIALRKSSPARVTAILYLSPPVTMLWAWLMFGEPLSWSMAAGLVISLAGIGIITHGGRAAEIAPETH